MLVIGCDGHSVKAGLIEHGAGVRNGVLLGDLAGPLDVDVSDCDQLGLFEELNRPRVNFANSPAPR